MKNLLIKIKVIILNDCETDWDQMCSNPLCESFIKFWMGNTFL